MTLVRSSRKSLAMATLKKARKGLEGSIRPLDDGCLIVIIEGPQGLPNKLRSADIDGRRAIVIRAPGVWKHYRDRADIRPFDRDGDLRAVLGFERCLAGLSASPCSLSFSAG